MKMNIEIDCSPEEARALLGLPDVTEANEAYVQNRDKGENIKALEKWCDKYDFDDWDRKVTGT